MEESEGVSAVLGDDFNHEKVGGLAPSVAGLAPRTLGRLRKSDGTIANFPAGSAILRAV